MAVYGNTVLREGLFKQVFEDTKRITNSRKFVLKKKYKEALEALKYCNTYSKEDLLFLYNFLISYGEKLLESSDKSEISEYIEFCNKNLYRFNNDNVRYKNISDISQKLKKR